MPTFTDEQQQKHREAFINECRQKAWGAACHAEWVAKGLDQVLADYQKLQEEDRGIDDAITKLRNSLDPTAEKENRAKIRALRERKDAIAKAVQAIGKNIAQGQQALTGLYQNVESNLALAKHAETSEWNETTPAPSAS